MAVVVVVVVVVVAYRGLEFSKSAVRLRGFYLRGKRSDTTGLGTVARQQHKNVFVWVLQTKIQKRKVDLWTVRRASTIGRDLRKKKTCLSGRLSRDRPPPADIKCRQRPCFLLQFIY